MSLRPVSDLLSSHPSLVQLPQSRNDVKDAFIPILCLLPYKLGIVILGRTEKTIYIDFGPHGGRVPLHPDNIFICPLPQPYALASGLPRLDIL